MTVYAPSNVKITVDAKKGLYQEVNDTAQFNVNSDVPLNVSGSFVVSGSTTLADAATDTITLAGDAYMLKVKEVFAQKVDATGVVVHDCTTGHVFYHTSPDANWTVNLTNFNLPSGYATSVTLVIIQGGTAYIPTALQIGGAAQTLNWQGNVVPSGTPNRQDVVSFSILNVGGTYKVLGQLVSF